MIIRSIFIFLLALVIFSPLAYAKTLEAFTGRVISILDGDTIIVLTPQNEKIRVRLTEIDAPESDQPFAQQSKEILSNRILNQNITVIKNGTGIDPHGRTLGRIFLTDENINLQMIFQGGAWAYRYYKPDKIFTKTENAAKKNKVGLWALPKDQRIPPWDWRHKGNNDKNTPP